jgi:hypothetical protein
MISSFQTVGQVAGEGFDMTQRKGQIAGFSQSDLPNAVISC